MNSAGAPPYYRGADSFIEVQIDFSADPVIPLFSQSVTFERMLLPEFRE